MSCQHNRRKGDNYGETCLDCGQVISGYGCWAEGGNKECIHQWLPDGEGAYFCPFCELTSKTNPNKSMKLKQIGNKGYGHSYGQSNMHLFGKQKQKIVSIKQMQKLTAYLNKHIPGLNLKIIAPAGDDLDTPEIKLVVFFNDLSGTKEKEYHEGCASNEAYILYTKEELWAFSFTVHNPGKMYEQNGDPGEPPSVEYVEPGKNWDDVYLALIDLLTFYYKDSINNALQEFELLTQNIETRGPEGPECTE